MPLHLQSVSVKCCTENELFLWMCSTFLSCTIEITGNLCVGDTFDFAQCEQALMGLVLTDVIPNIQCDIRICGGKHLEKYISLLQSLCLSLNRPALDNVLVQIDFPSNHCCIFFISYETGNYVTEAVLMPRTNRN